METDFGPSRDSNAYWFPCLGTHPTHFRRSTSHFPQTHHSVASQKRRRTSVNCNFFPRGTFSAARVRRARFISYGAKSTTPARGGRWRGVLQLLFRLLSRGARQKARPDAFFHSHRGLFTPAWIAFISRRTLRLTAEIATPCSRIRANLRPGVCVTSSRTIPTLPHGYCSIEEKSSRDFMASIDTASRYTHACSHDHGAIQSTLQNTTIF